jgi:ribosomal protein L10
MNFLSEYKKGQAGGNKGLSMGTGVSRISSAINGIQRGRIYGIAAAAKAGKSTFVDYAFVINPIIAAHKEGKDLEVIYFSFEIDRISKEFDFMAYFLHLEYKIDTISLENGQTKDGKNFIYLNSDYLRGRLQDDNNKIIKVKESIEEVMLKVYKKWIIPLFGEFDDNGKQISKGFITFIESKDNPTGIYKYLKRYAEKHGSWIKVPTTDNKTRITGYIPKNPKKFTFIVTDHLRKLLPEKGFSKKEVVDKMIEYQVELRNWCAFTFIDIIHTNRDIVDPDRLKFAKDMLYPTSDDIKDTGNLSEDADYIFTVFNPNDQRYNLMKHFGLQIKETKSKNLIYPHLRTIHLVESRHCVYPQHFRVNMMGQIKTFKPFKEIT